MAILFTSEFGINKSAMIKVGTFNVLLDEDSHFFINIKRLEATEVPEFSTSYEQINDYFRKIAILLKAAKPGDKNYRTAIKLFNFPEVNGINLGFSASKRGAGFGDKLKNQIIKDAYDIIKSGSEYPEIFHLTSLFEENVGPDRLSDMIARIIYNDIIKYTKRIYKELEVNQENYPQYYFNKGIPKNPYKSAPILLLPIDILHELPIARDWDDIDRVCRENEAIRKEINELVGNEWSKLASSQKKKYLKEWVFKNPNRIERIIDSYKKSTVAPYNIYSDINYLIQVLLNEIEVKSDTETTSLEAAIFIVTCYKEWVEYHKGNIVLSEIDSKKAEKTVQRTLHSTAIAYCKQNDWDLSPETDSGRGPVDFKISRGHDKTVIEVKLTSNPQYMHGFKVQIEEYAKAEGTTNRIYVLVDNVENSKRVDEVKQERDLALKQELNPPNLIIIDSKPKKSASKY